MIFTSLELAGAYLVEPERHQDERGFFARTFCAREFEAMGLDSLAVQSSLSYNRRRGTLRGLHWQAAPHEEAKLVRCTRGAIWDVIVDLRADSASHRRWVAVELSADNRNALYVPRGFAHGFLTLTDDTEVLYQMSTYYRSGAARGARWDDPAFAIEWPFPPEVLSERDAGYPGYEGRA